MGESSSVGGWTRCPGWRKGWLGRSRLERPRSRSKGHHWRVATPVWVSPCLLGCFEWTPYVCGFGHHSLSDGGRQRLGNPPPWLFPFGDFPFFAYSWFPSFPFLIPSQKHCGVFHMHPPHLIVWGRERAIYATLFIYWLHWFIKTPIIGGLGFKRYNQCCEEQPHVHTHLNMCPIIFY